MKKVISLLIFLLNFPLSPFPVQAQEPNFAVSQEIIYQIQPNGSAHVVQNFAITNLASDFFPKEYQFSLGQQKISNLVARDRLGILSTRSQTTVSGTDIHLGFNDQVAGLGKILRFNLSYQVDNIAKKPGRLWQIFISPTSKVPGLTEFALRIVTPESFGKIVLTKPEIVDSDLFWQGTDFANLPIIVTFDPESEKIPFETYAFNLKYHLYNSRLYPVITQITLPPDGVSQKSSLSKLTPKPSNVTISPEGNWLAAYQLGPTQKLDVTAEGSATVFLRFQTNDLSLPSSQDIKPGKFWPQDSQIKKAILDHNNPQDIYKLTLSSLEYQTETSQGGRRGAKLAFLSPDIASAWDFADVFVALARTVKIPSRVVVGWQESVNKPHVWAQFYNPGSKSWTMVDPTLEKITGLDYFRSFDTQHLSLAVIASDQTWALPDEMIIAATTKGLTQNSLPHVTAFANFPKNLTAGFPASGKIFIENLGPTSFLPQTVSLTSSDLEFDHDVFVTSAIAPFGHQEFPVTVKPTGWGTQRDVIISLKFGLDKQEYSVSVIPLYKNGYLVIFGGLIILGLISLVAQITRSLLLQKQKRRDNLRREGKQPS